MGVAGRGIGTAMSNTLGLSTGAGASSVQAAYQAGKSSDSSFLAHLRGDANMGDIVQQAKDALGNMRAARNADYKSGMIDVTSDRTVLDMNPIQKTLDSAPSGMFNGKVVNPDVVNKVQAIRDKVGEWASGDPEIFHTPEGMDQLKQAIGAIRETTQPGTAARTAADQVYNSVKNEIVKQAPAYAKVMSGYQEASDQLTEITKALSLGNKASADTSLRKLQSVMRNNVNTNYGNRAALVGQLEDQGGASIVPSLAGQALNSWTPRGLQGLADTGIGGAAMYLHSPTLAAALPFTSPRLVGEGSYLAGKMAGKAGGAASAIANKLPLTAEDLQRLTAQPAVVLPGSVTNAVTSR
jgi:hypothetical protein